ncbi:ABC transporter ATP-binding protein [Pseudooceanicola onchidii]|uniref:iron ABC transporter ATP-binding protein n=1 Tax=Pseudooceanicola onchidii TaxID=2562279 RepID=UPI0010AACE72|nr:ATP-binding cassette domain-containing protein [Pseudooceanicola onchidii]
MIRIEGLSHAIGGSPILHDIDLTLPEGGVTALIGPNGAGKSTLLSLIARLQKIQAGRITVGGQEVGRTSDRDLARTLAVMAQSTHVSARLSVADLVSFGRYPWHRGRPGAIDRDHVEQALTRFDLLALRHRFLDEISGGQRQRAFVAMAYAQDTPYLLLDEPLNNLDIAAARDLMGLVRDMADRDGRTVVIVLHDINYATGFADRLVVLKDGRIAAQGQPAQIVTEALLRDVFGTSATVETLQGRPYVVV